MKENFAFDTSLTIQEKREAKGSLLLRSRAVFGPQRDGAGRDGTGRSPGLVSPQESLIDVGFQEARVAVPGHQAVDELLRRVKGRQTGLAHVLRDVLSGAAVDVDLKRNDGARGGGRHGNGF